MRNEIQDCQLIVKKFKADIYKKTKSSDLPQHNNCIQNTLRNENWADKHMKKTVFEASVLAEDEKFQKIEEMRKEIFKEFEIASKFCVLEEEYGEIFEIFFNFNDLSEEDKKLLTCMRKYSIYQELIKGYNMTSVEYSISNCTDTINAFMSDVERGLEENLKVEKSNVTQEQIDCSLKVYREEKYTQKLIAAVVLGKLNPNESDKLREKRNFIKFMTLITLNVQKCFT